MGTIYVFENIVNGMKYVGKTKNRFVNRLDCHLSGKYNYYYFSRALKRYGIDNFNITLKFYPDKYLDNEEKRLIKEFKDKDPKCLYNLTAGGDGITNPCASTRRKISEKAKNQFKIQGHPMQGKIHREESRRKISENTKLMMDKPDINKKMRESMKKAWSDSTRREKQSILMKEVYKNPELIKKISESVKNAIRNK